ncbi:aromatic ring-hydroxylating oxygenase subunit alpha, partial [Rhodococcus sp. (in: high G+C Gram-positive bacteria)]|uniref:aromatic ring-hydroxylating oxygenase subunit alpha n=1 Tax=Rhodococcus sp. TaxID=1831 RepID=UPI003BAE33E9
MQPERIHGSLYTNEDVFADELERIWYRSWVFVGHTSEVPAPNDYVRKKLGLQDVIMTRDKSGEVHLLLNRCAHRANLVCDDASGNSSAFRCPYHGWTYRNNGELLGYPQCRAVRRVTVGSNGTHVSKGRVGACGTAELPVSRACPRKTTL